MKHPHPLKDTLVAFNVSIETQPSSQPQPANHNESARKTCTKNHNLVLAEISSFDSRNHQRRFDRRIEITHAYERTSSNMKMSKRIRVRDYAFSDAGAFSFRRNVAELSGFYASRNIARKRYFGMTRFHRDNEFSVRVLSLFFCFFFGSFVFHLLIFSLGFYLFESRARTRDQRSRPLFSAEH